MCVSGAAGALLDLKENPMNKSKPLIRAAIAIHDRLTPDQPTFRGELPLATWRQCESMLRRARRAQSLGWHLAADRLQRDLQFNLQRLRAEVCELEHQLTPAPTSAHVASIRDILADLVALNEEFGEIAIDRKEQTVSVTTEPIDLEGVYLGPFEIQLDWSDLAHGHPHNYRVIAVEPSPAASSDSVVHPHVQDEAVCEGEGRQPIRNALAQGRLYDFFTIVANLLRTYNSGSPFVSLSEWYGAECADCGANVSGDDSWTCERCEASVCGECHYSCPGCDRTFCFDCVTRCESCDDHHCGSCMTECDVCHNEICQGCLDDNERCPNCHEEETEEQIATEEISSSNESADRGGADAPVLANCLGETAVPA
jgi:hypothetical protein